MHSNGDFIVFPGSLCLTAASEKMLDPPIDFIETKSADEDRQFFIFLVVQGENDKKPIIFKKKQVG